MKKTMILFLTMLVSMGIAQADEITVGNVTIPQGGTAVVNISLNNPDHQYTAGQMALSLPEGVIAVLKGNGDLTVEKGERFSSTNHSIGASHKSDGTEQFTIFSINSEAIAGTSGFLLVVTIMADESLAVGTVLEGKLLNIEMTTTDAVPTPFNNQTFTITITEPVGPILLDEASTRIPEATDEAVELTVKRTLKAGVWNTLCLPFDMTEAQLKAAFGDDVQLAEFTDYDPEYDDADNVTAITVNFTDTDLSEGLYGNWPYLIKVSASVTAFTLTAEIAPDEESAVAEYDNGKKGKQRVVYGRFIGTLHAGETVPENDLFISDDKFYYSTGISTIQAFRAYLWLDDKLTAGGAASVGVRIGGRTTFVDELAAPTGDSIFVYDLIGRKLQNADAITKGIYIKGNRKMLVK